MTQPLKFEAKRRRLGALAVAALATGVFVAAPAAQAQFFFRPFAYGFSRPMEEPAVYGSRRAIAQILARGGYRLVGPLGSRGDQVVAFGVDARGQRVRFLIDPYEGRVLFSRPVGIARMEEAPGGYGPPGAAPDERPDLPPRTEGAGPNEPRVIEGIDGERVPNAEPRANVDPHRNGAPGSRRQTAARPQAGEAPPTTAPSPSVPQPPAAAAPSVQRPNAPAADAGAPAPATVRRPAHHEGGVAKRAIAPPAAAQTPAAPIQGKPTPTAASPVSAPPAPAQAATAATAASPAASPAAPAAQQQPAAQAPAPVNAAPAATAASPEQPSPSQSAAPAAQLPAQPQAAATPAATAPAAPAPAKPEAAATPAPADAQKPAEAAPAKDGQSKGG